MTEAVLGTRATCIRLGSSLVFCLTRFSLSSRDTTHPRYRQANLARDAAQAVAAFARRELTPELVPLSRAPWRVTETLSNAWAGRVEECS